MRRARESERKTPLSFLSGVLGIKKRDSEKKIGFYYFFFITSFSHGRSLSRSVSSCTLTLNYACLGKEGLF